MRKPWEVKLDNCSKDSNDNKNEYRYDYVDINQTYICHDTLIFPFIFYIFLLLFYPLFLNQFYD